MNKALFVVGVLCVTVWGSGVWGQQQQECTGGKADITFVLDYSTSVGEYNFNQFMLPAVADIIDGMGTISADSVRVAVVGFSTRPYLEFVFNDYLDKARLLRVVKSLNYKYGNTATGEALYVVLKDLVPRVRAGVKHLVIVLTDGVMNEGRDMEPPAVALRKTGAEVFAIGVGAYMDKAELMKLVSSEDRIILLKDFNDLLLRTKEVTKLTCKTLTVMNEEAEKPASNCTGGKTEFTFVLDASGSVGVAEFDRNVKSTVQTIVSTLNIGPNGDRVALVLYASAATLIFNLDTYNSAAQIYNAVQNIRYTGGGTATGEAIALVQDSILPKARVGVTHIVVVITDGNSNIGRPVPAAALALRKTGVLLFSVGVGAGVSKESLLDIAGRPENVISVGDYAELKKRAGSIATSACQTAKKDEIKLPQSCQGRQEVFITLLVDNSADQGVEHFRKRLLTFITSVVSTLSPLQTGVSFSLVTYSGSAQVEFNFNTYSQNFDNIVKHISALQLSTSRERMLGRAFTTVRTEIANKVKSGATHVVALFTAGEPSVSDCYTEVATLLLESGVQLVVVPSHHQMERKTVTDLTSLSSTVENKMKAILSYSDKVENPIRVNGLVNVVCALVPPK